MHIISSAYHFMLPMLKRFNVPLQEFVMELAVDAGLLSDKIETSVILSKEPSLGQDMAIRLEYYAFVAEVLAYDGPNVPISEYIQTSAQCRNRKHREWLINLMKEPDTRLVALPQRHRRRTRRKKQR